MPSKKPKLRNEKERLTMLNAKPAANEEPNLRLFYQLSPQVEPMARAMKVSKPTIYNIVGERKYNPKAETVTRFNAYLKELLSNRLKWADKNTAKKKTT